MQIILSTDFPLLLVGFIAGVVFTLSIVIGIKCRNRGKAIAPGKRVKEVK
jgi:hypothetical protein